MCGCFLNSHTVLLWLLTWLISYNQGSRSEFHSDFPPVTDRRRKGIGFQFCCHQPSSCWIVDFRTVRSLSLGNLACDCTQDDMWRAWYIFWMNVSCMSHTVSCYFAPLYSNNLGISSGTHSAVHLYGCCSSRPTTIEYIRSTLWDKASNIREVKQLGIGRSTHAVL